MQNTARIIDLLQLVIGLILIISIIFQNRGAGLSNVFGGTGTIYRTKRGFEKWLFYSTIVMAIIFVALSALAVFVSKP